MCVVLEAKRMGLRAYFLKNSFWRLFFLSLLVLIFAVIVVFGILRAAVLVGLSNMSQRVVSTLVLCLIDILKYEYELSLQLIAQTDS